MHAAQIVSEALSLLCAGAPSLDPLALRLVAAELLEHLLRGPGKADVRVSRNSITLAATLSVSLAQDNHNHNSVGAGSGGATQSQSHTTASLITALFQPLADRRDSLLALLKTD